MAEANDLFNSRNILGNINLNKSLRDKDGNELYGSLSGLSGKLDNLKSQFKLAKNGTCGNCWQLAANEQGGAENIPSRNDAEKHFKENYSFTKDINEVNFKMLETKIGFYGHNSKDTEERRFNLGVPKSELNQTYLKHVSRFVWENTQGTVYTVNKMSVLKRLYIGTIGGKWHRSGTNQNHLNDYIKYFTKK